MQHRFYSWKKKFGDTSSDQAKLVRRLQRENERLTRGPATVRAGSHEGCPGKKAVTTGQKREAAQQLHHKGLTQKRACELASLPPSSFYYQPRTPNVAKLTARIRELALEHPARGYRFIHKLLCREGW